MRRIGRLQGIRDGKWTKVCDYLVVWRTAIGDHGRDNAMFVELKKTLAGDRSGGMEQLRRSRPYLDYLRSVCRVEFGAISPPMGVPTRYVLIGERLSQHLAKQRVSRGHLRSSDPVEKVSRHLGTAAGWKEIPIRLAGRPLMKRALR